MLPLLVLMYIGMIVNNVAKLCNVTASSLFCVLCQYIIHPYISLISTLHVNDYDIDHVHVCNKIVYLLVKCIEH